MRNLDRKIWKLSLHLCALVLVANCGESFRSNETVENNTVTRNNSTSQQYNPTTRTTSEFFDVNGNRVSEGPANVEEEIIDIYGGKSSWNTFGTQSLVSEIKAFDLILQQGTSSSFNVEARLARGCSDFHSFTRSVPMAQLQQGQRVSLGNSGSYQAFVQCSNSGCSEMVAGIVKTGSFETSTVLIGLAVAGKVDNSRILYISRSVGLTTYYATFPQIQQYEQQNQCSVTNTTGQNIFQNIIGNTADSLVRDGINSLSNWLFGL